MKIFKENECLTLTKSINAQIIGEGSELTLAVGTIATVVLVHGDPDRPSAYEIEAYIAEQDCYALATIAVGDI